MQKHEEKKCANDEPAVVWAFVCHVLSVDIFYFLFREKFDLQDACRKLKEYHR
jgi:hypothetical protein